MITRAGAATDWRAVNALIARSFAYMTPMLGHPPRAVQATAADLAAETKEGAVFVVNDPRPVACLFTRPSRDLPDALYIGRLAVAESHRGRGLARRLVEAAADEARARGLSALTLDTGAAFAELHAGFARMGFGPPAPRAGAPGVVTMVRRLD